MPSVFTNIYLGELPGQIVWQDKQCFALVPLHPANYYHLLIIPKKEVDYIFDLPVDIYNHLWAVSRWIAPAVQSAAKCSRVGVGVEGFAVPHVHIHLVPLYKAGEMDLHRARAVDDKKQAELAAVLRAEIAKLEPMKI